jgi:hypothetical protein
MTQKLIIGLIFASLIGMLWFANSTRAEDEDLILDYPGKPGPLFNEVNWVPGDSVTRTLTIKNGGSAIHDFAVAVNHECNPQVLSQVLRFQVKKGEENLLDVHLSDIASGQELYLVSIAPDEQINLDFTISMDDVGNEYQNLKACFDLTVGFVGQVEGGEVGPVEPQVKGISVAPAVKGALVSAGTSMYSLLIITIISAAAGAYIARRKELNLKKK